jgi:uncharacterized UBP type Zn finger protein
VSIIVNGDQCPHQTCAKVNSILEDLISINLPTPDHIKKKKNVYSIVDCLEKFFSQTEIDNNFCSFCQNESKANRKVSLFTTPEYLVLTLKRKNFGEY